MLEVTENFSFIKMCCLNWKHWGFHNLLIFSCFKMFDSFNYLEHPLVEWFPWLAAPSLSGCQEGGINLELRKDTLWYDSLSSTMPECHFLT